MKILLGVDNEGHYRSALTLLARMRLQEAELTMLHADPETSFPVALPHTPIFSGTSAPVALHPAGNRLLDHAIEEAEKAGFRPLREHEAGQVTEQILLQSHQLPADLVAIGSRNRNPLIATLLGSTGRDLATHSPCSFLVAHGEVAPMGPVKCVFATDNSIFAEAAFDKFLEWMPAGISEITVFTVIKPEDQAPGSTVSDVTDAAAFRCSQLSARLQRKGIRSSIRLRIGTAAQEIDTAMHELQADLLILGARGHGFTQRLFLGSVATHIVDAARYPVLVLRP